MRKFLIRHIWWMTLIISLAMLVGHTFSVNAITIDSTSIILLAIIAFSPLISTIRKIKIGDVEAEINSEEVERVKEKVETEVKQSVNENGDPDRPEFHKEILKLAETDSVLSLAKIRIEIERSISRLSRIANIMSDIPINRSLGQQIIVLSKKEIVPKGLAESTLDVIRICNRAIHGEDIKPKDAIDIVIAGLSILADLNDIVGELSLKPKEEKIISREEVEMYRDAKYKITSVIPLVENPKFNVRILDQEGLDELLEGYNEYAEFIVGIEMIS